MIDDAIRQRVQDCLKRRKPRLRGFHVGCSRYKPARYKPLDGDRAIY
jgi:hypothetical protein